MGPGLIARIVAATAVAIEAWEPRVELKRVDVLAAKDGRVQIDIVIALNGVMRRLEDVG
jgi:phage baseplate assembly protein W